MSKRTFCAITQAEFEETIGVSTGVLVAGLAFYRTPLKGCVELVYESNQSEELSIRVYSSVIPRTKEVRDCGEDAIRICHVYYGKDRTFGRIVGTQKRVNRIQTWKKNLIQRINEVARDEPVVCPVCFSPMVLRSGNFGKFFGCVSFPKCKGTRNVER